MVDLDGKHAMFRITSEGQKSGRDQLLPIAPEFSDYLNTIPKKERRGLVFGITHHRDTAVHIISELGRRRRSASLATARRPPATI